MTREGIKKIVYQDKSTVNFNLYSKAFDSEITHEIYVPTLNWTTGEREMNLDKLVTPYITNCVNSFLALKKKDFLEDLQEKIFKLFNVAIESTSYGQVPDELLSKYGNTEANRIFFNGESKESVYKNCNFNSVFYDNDNGPEVRFSVLASIEWDIEHGLTLFFENSKLVNIE